MAREANATACGVFRCVSVVGGRFSGPGAYVATNLPAAMAVVRAALERACAAGRESERREAVTPEAIQRAVAAFYLDYESGNDDDAIEAAILAALTEPKGEM